MTTAKRALAISLIGVSPVVGFGTYAIAYRGDGFWGVSISVVVVFGLLFAGSLVTLRDRLALRACGTGFGLAIVLSSLSMWSGGRDWLARHNGVLLAMCPPSIVSIGLERAGLAQVLITWLYIAIINGALYALAAASLRWLWRNQQVNENRA